MTPSTARFTRPVPRIPALVLHAALAAIALLLFLLPFLTPFSQSNRYTNDAVYLLNAAQLVAQGYRPHIDFQWQFGGYESYLVSLALRLFGQSFKAIEYGTAFAYAITSALLYLATGKSTRPAIFALLLLLVSATVLTRFPFEDGAPTISVQSFAMGYNRYCWALLMVPFSAVMTGSEPLRARQAVASGIALWLIVVTKLTFLLAFPLAFALILWRGGRRQLGICAATMAACALLGWILLGYAPASYVGAVRDILDVTRAVRTGAAGPIKKLAYILFFNGLSIAALLIAIGMLAHRNRTIRALQLRAGALVILLVLSIGITVTTGTYLTFNATTPMLAFAAIIAADLALDTPTLSHDARRWTASALALFAILFAIPYLANYLANIAKAATRGSLVVFDRGPLAHLIIDRPEAGATRPFDSSEAAGIYIARRAALEPDTSWLTDYEWQYIVEDGLRLAWTLPHRAQARVISFSPAVFPFLLAAAPVSGFPLYPSLQTAATQKLATLPADVDAVMVAKLDRTNPLLKHFGAALEAGFRPAAQSRFWILYLRKAPAEARGR